MGGRFKDLIVVSFGVAAFAATLAIYTAPLPAGAVSPQSSLNCLRDETQSRRSWRWQIVSGLARTGTDGHSPPDRCLWH